MYLIKELDYLKLIKQAELSRIVGIKAPTMCRIFGRKQTCSKTTAYAICKAININYEIEDLFERTE